jgi:hypothetical protein
MLKSVCGVPPRRVPRYPGTDVSCNLRRQVNRLGVEIGTIEATPDSYDSF